MLGRWWPRRRQDETIARAATDAEDAGDALRPRWLRWVLDLPADSAGADAHALAGPASPDPIAAAIDVARLPRLPALLPTLLAALRREDVRAQALADCVARDPVVAGEVLRVANSAYYRRARAVDDLTAAVQRLGHDGLRRVALAVLMRPIAQGERLPSGSRTFDRLWMHTQRHMTACALLAPGRCDASDVQLAAVLGTTGLSALLRHAPMPVLMRAAVEAAAALELHRAAARLTTRAARHWRVPDGVVEALEQAAEGDRRAPAAAVLVAGERLAMASVLGEDAPHADALPLALDAGTCRAVIARLAQEFPEAPDTPQAG